MRNILLNYIKDDLRSPFVIITCGLPATLKTTVALHIAEARDCDLFRTDLIRKEVLANEDIFDPQLAADMDRRTLVYDELFRRAAACETDCFILDATFILQSLRRRAAAEAATRHSQLVIVETVCPRDTALARLRQRTRDTTDSNALTEDAYLDNEIRFEPVDIMSLSEEFPGVFFTHVTVDTTDYSPENWIIVNITTSGRSA